MSSLGSPNSFFLAGKKAYEVERSLRFNSADDAYLTRTPSSTGNQKVWTWSAWFKRTNLGGDHKLFASNETNSSGHGLAALYFASNDKLNTYYDTPSGQPYGAVNDRVYRDVSAWYHIVWQVDAANTTQKIWINGVEETLSSSYNPIDYNYTMNQSGYTNVMGANPWNTSNTSDMYLAEVHFSDGYKYAASDFAETNLLTGQWMPKKFVGSYGTNGFYLNFSDNSGTTATTLGKDSSGNGNNFTPNNFVTGDAVKDSPTNNFSTLRIYKTPAASGSVLSEGNLRHTSGSSGSARNLNRIGISTFLQTSGKWYAEVKLITNTNQTAIGVSPYQVGLSSTGNNSRYVFIYGDDGNKYVNTNGSESNSSHGGSYTQNDIIGIYIDMDASTPEVYFAKNGQWADGSGSWNQSSPTSAISLGNTFFTQDTGGNEGIGIMVHSGSGGTSVAYQANFGQDSTFSGGNTAGGNTDASGIGDFKYTVPTGAKALCSANLPDPTIKLPNKHFDTLLWTGNGSTQSITGLNFEPDWVWTKPRSQAYGHGLFDSVRGGNQRLDSSASQEDRTNEGNISFESDGFNVTSSHSTTNQNGSTMAAWNWNAGDTDGKTYTVTVVSDSGNKYRFDGYGTSAVTLDLAEGGTYIFNYPSAHPFRFSTTADGTHGGGSEYTTGVTHNSSTQVTIVVAASAPQLYYYCSLHSGMGGAINTNSTLGSSNFDGAIQTTAKVNVSTGFSIVTYTGTGSNTTIGHGLGVVPQAAIFKRRDSTGNWMVYHQELGNTHNLYLNTSDNSQDDSHAFNDTSPTSSVFTLGISGFLNANSGTFVGYLFSEVAGYSKFGSYTGNGSSDGPFIFLGFRPSIVIAKRTDSTGYWRILDNKRDPHNVAHHALFANASETESNVDASNQYNTDFYSNGFKLRTTLASSNASGGTWIYLAFAESPFKNARAR